MLFITPASLVGGVFCQPRSASTSTSIFFPRSNFGPFPGGTSSGACTIVVFGWMCERKTKATCSAVGPICGRRPNRRAADRLAGRGVDDGSAGTVYRRQEEKLHPRDQKRETQKQTESDRKQEERRNFFFPSSLFAGRKEVKKPPIPHLKKNVHNLK